LDAAALGVLRGFLEGGGEIDEGFMGYVIEAAYAPLVRLVGEGVAQEAMRRLAAGVLLGRGQKGPQVKVEEEEQPGAALNVAAATQ
jgi:hypothetical protein